MLPLLSLSGPKRRSAVALLSFLLASMVIYSPSLFGDYIWDDNSGLMLGNPQMDASWGWLENWFAPQTLNYEPVTFDSFWIQKQLFGENHFVFHLTNIVLHAFNAWLVY